MQCNILFAICFYFRDMNFLYPYGATLNVAQPSTVVLSSGSVTIPTNRPICAYHCNETIGGKLLVLGSSLMLTDAYIEKEKNDALREMIFEFFESKDIVFKESQMDDVDVCFQTTIITYISYIYKYLLLLTFNCCN